MQKDCLFNLAIGPNAGRNLMWSNYCLIIGEDQCSDVTELPDDFVSIKGVFEGVVTNPIYRQQMRLFLSSVSGKSNHETTIFVVNLCKELGIDHVAVAKVLTEIFSKDNTRFATALPKQTEFPKFGVDNFIQHTTGENNSSSSEQSPIDRAAMALWKADGSPTIPIMPSVSQIAAWGQDQDKYRRMARAVLMAIREPSEAMGNSIRAADCLAGDVHAIWSAMIDAALEEK